MLQGLAASPTFKHKVFTGFPTLPLWLVFGLPLTQHFQDVEPWKLFDLCYFAKTELIVFFGGQLH